MSNDEITGKTKKTKRKRTIFTGNKGVTYEKGCQVTSCSSPLRPFLRVS